MKEFTLENLKGILNNNLGKVGITFLLTFGLPTYTAWNGLNLVVPQNSVSVTASGQKITQKNDWANLSKFMIMFIFSGPAISLELITALILVGKWNKQMHGSVFGKNPES
jgi:hypothetical protein